LDFIPELYQVLEDIWLEINQALSPVIIKLELNTVTVEVGVDGIA
jgi:hypothetical protein